MSCPVLNIYDPAKDAATLNTLALLYEMQFALDRMFRNTQLINVGVNAKLINVSGTTLFNVAVDEYDDARLWGYLAQINNILDPTIVGATQLIIPPKPPAGVGFGR